MYRGKRTFTKPFLIAAALSFCVQITALSPAGAWPTNSSTVPDDAVFSTPIPVPLPPPLPADVPDAESSQTVMNRSNTQSTKATAGEDTSGAAGLVSTLFDGDLYLYVPISITFADSYKLLLVPSLAYNRPGDGDFNNGSYGFGDSMLGFRFKYDLWSSNLAISGISLKFPTGDPQATSNNGDERLPLGSGSWDGIISQSAIFLPGEEFIVFASLALRFNGHYKFTRYHENVTEHAGHGFYYYLQGERTLYVDSLNFYLALGGRANEEGYTEVAGRVSGDKNRLLLLEGTFGFKYYLQNDVAFQLGATYPLYIREQHDTTAPYPQRFSPHLAIQSWF
jgi:hypothetical protein